MPGDVWLYTVVVAGAILLLICHRLMSCLWCWRRLDAWYRAWLAEP